MDTPEKTSKNNDFSYKAKIIYQFSAVGFSALVIFGIVNLIQNQTSAGIIELVFGLAILGNVVYLRWQRNVALAGSVVLFLMLGVLGFLLVNGGIDKSGLFWFYTYPALAFFLKGRKKGMVWILVLLSMIALITGMSMLTLVEIPFSAVIIRQLLVSLLAVSFLIYFYQQINEEKEKLLEIDREDHERQAKILEEKDLVIQDTLKSVEEQNHNLSNTKLAMLNVLEDARELQTKLESQTKELRKFQLAADSAYEHIIITDNKGLIIYANNGAERNTGYKKTEMIGKTTSLWGGQMDKDYYQKMWQTLTVEKAPFTGEITNKRKSGENYLAQLNISPILDSSGDIQFFVGLENDITKERSLADNLRKEKAGVELKVQERTEELSEEQAKLQASINSLNVGFIMTDNNFEIVNINSTAKRILCITEFEKSLRSFSEAGANCKLEDIEETLKGAIDLKSEIRKCLTYKNIVDIKEVNFGDRILHFFLSPIALYTNKLEIIGAVILVEDITEQKVIERSKDEFFSIASHELRTPLTAIRGNTALMKDYYYEQIKDKDLKLMIDDIHESSIRLIQIVNDFLDTSRLEQNRITFTNEDFDLPTLIDEVFKELTGNVTELGIYLKLKPSDVPIPLVFADRDRVKQVLFNLIGNAIKFTTKGGVTVVLEPKDALVKVNVSDTGRGIPAANRNLLFHKFQQAANSILTRDTTRGTGLGLYISKLLVEGMGGKLQLEKSEENVGSTFSFVLPAVVKSKTIALTESKPQVPSKKVRRFKIKKPLKTKLAQNT